MTVTLEDHAIKADGKDTGEPRFPVIVGNYATVAHGAIVLDGCLVEKNVILGAGAAAAPGAVLKITWLRDNAELYVELCRENLANAYA